MVVPSKLIEAVIAADKGGNDCVMPALQDPWMTYLRSARLLGLQVFFEPFCEYLNFNEVYTAITSQTENILIGPAEAQGGGISSRLESPEQLRYATLRPGKLPTARSYSTSLHWMLTPACRSRRRSKAVT
jgi:hypothetical protein